MTDAYLYAALGWLLGGVFNGIAGFGAALVAMPLVLAHLPASVAVPACTCTVLALNVQFFWHYRRSARPGNLRPLLVGAIPGAVAGVLALRGLPEADLRLALGVLIGLYALWGLFLERPRRGRVVAPIWGVLVGFLSTLFGTAFGINGPPLVVYSTFSDWTQDEIKAALGTFFLATGAIMVATQALAGLESMASLSLFALATPAVMLGCPLGIRISRHLGEGAYRKVLYAALLLVAADMVRKALPGLS